MRARFATKDRTGPCPLDPLGKAGSRVLIHRIITAKRSDPLNAIVLPSMRFAEAEAVLAAIRSGHPGLGLSTTRQGRQSLALDRIEPGKPLVRRLRIEPL